jgi:hypothetical protein
MQTHKSRQYINEALAGKRKKSRFCMYGFDLPRTAEEGPGVWAAYVSTFSAAQNKGAHSRNPFY